MFIATDTQPSNPIRHVELDIDIGADAKDWSAIQAGEKLKPVETELRRIEELVSEIVAEMDYLKQRETKLRDTNESTNERVKWFAFGTMGMLVGLGAWQVVYLRAYFRSVSPLSISYVTVLTNAISGRSILFSALLFVLLQQILKLVARTQKIEQFRSKLRIYYLLALNKSSVVAIVSFKQNRWLAKRATSQCLTLLLYVCFQLLLK